MANFPTIQLPARVTETDVSTRLMETSEAGYTMLRSRGAVAKKEFELTWTDITSADKGTLQTFFRANYGLAFVWTHFETAAPYNVCFKSENLNFIYLAPGYWSVSFWIKEI